MTAIEKAGSVSKSLKTSPTTGTAASESAGKSGGGSAGQTHVVPKSWAELAADRSGHIQPCEQYVVELVESVRQRLLAFLKGKEPAVGGINLVGTLEQQEPLHIDSAAGPLHTTKEHWRWENRRMSLETKGAYEAPGNLLWLSADKPAWGGEALPATSITYGEVASGRQTWSDEKFRRSSDVEEKRQYFAQGVIPSAVLSMADVPTRANVGFLKLPCLASRAVLIGWYSVVDDALRGNAYGKVLKLYAAALSTPMRLRCGPSKTQVCLDSITYSEDLFAANASSSDSFFDFTQKVIQLFPAELAVGSMSVKAVISAADKAGISYHGIKVNDNCARALQNVAPFAQSTKAQTAFKDFEDVSPALTDQTKISQPTHVASKHFGKGHDAAVGAFVELLSALRAGLLHNDIPKDSHLTKEFLVGGRNKAGFSHVF